MTEMIAKYDPNIGFGKHSVELTLMRFDHSLIYTARICGNCRGLDVIEAAVLRLLEDGSVVSEDDEGILSIRLNDANGSELLVEDDEDFGGEWLKSMIVSARIIGFEPEPKKAGSRP